MARTVDVRVVAMNDNCLVIAVRNAISIILTPEMPSKEYHKESDALYRIRTFVVSLQ